MFRPSSSLLRTSALVLAVHTGAASVASARENEAQGSAVSAPAGQGTLGGDLNSKFAIDDAHPERSLPSPEQALKNPLEMGYLMMDLIARAEAASQRGDHAAAVRYYRAVASAVPERAVAFSKLCKAHEALGEVQEAIRSCRKALGKGGAELEDYRRFVRLSLATPGPLDQATVDDVEAVVSHLERELAGDPAAELTVPQLRCELAARLESTDKLRACTQVLMERAPQDARTLTYRWALALATRDFEEAERILAQARGARLGDLVIRRMRESLDEARLEPASASTLGDWLTLLAALVLLALAVSYVARQRSQTSNSAT